MKKMKKTAILALALAGVMAVTTGCGSDFDAAGYVASYFEAMVDDNVTNYAKLTGSTEEEARQELNDGVEEGLAAFMEAGATEAQAKEFTQIMFEALSKSEYSVGAATKTDDGYLVPVTISPTQLDSEQLQQEITDNVSAGIDEHFAPESEEEVTQWTMDILLEAYHNALGNATVGEPVDLEVPVVLNADGEYEIPSENLAEVMSVLNSGIVVN